MAKENNQEERQNNSLNNVIPSGGINTDISPVNQPPGTMRFVLSGVDETKEGDLGTITTEESNEICYQIPKYPNNSSGTPYIPLGKVYVGDNSSVILFGHPSGNSLICELDKECNLIVHVDDSSSLQIDKLGFSVSKQIDITFRLRKGCERTIYWVDPKPRMFVLDKPEDFKIGNLWNISKFNLFKTYKSIPIVTKLEVLDSGGSLASGSYNFSIQYLDQDFNPTEFIFSTPTVVIYNDLSNTNYKNLRGSTKEVNPYTEFADSGKAIKLELDPNSLDKDFSFYRIAITEANTGSGLISATKYTSEISTDNNVFVYTGINYESEGTQEEITSFNNVIDEAESIEQIENRLVLGNIKGKNLPLCNLQKYASKVSADLVTKEILYVTTSRSNPKDPSLNFNGVGYMPGEIYCFGIVFIFEDNTLSPVYHIPGKNNTVNENKMYSAGTTVYPMSKNENSCLDAQYIDNKSCAVESFWGVDCEGETLTNKPVRHHRFPLRTDYNIPFITKLSSDEVSRYTKNLVVKIVGEDHLVPLICEEGEDPLDCTPNTYDDYPPVEFQVVYLEGTEEQTFTDSVDFFDYSRNTGDPLTYDVNWISTSPIIYEENVTVTKIVETTNGTSIDLTPVSLTPVVDINGYDTYTFVSATSGLTYLVTVSEAIDSTKEEVYSSQMFGIKFSNIQKPTIEDSGKEVIGYYIVRQERTPENKTILDSAILTPSLIYKQFTAHGLLYPLTFLYVPGTGFNPIQNYTPDYSKDIFGFISPEHKFNNVQYSNFTKIIQQGEFTKTDVVISRSVINDVADGSSYVSGRHKSNESDDDGFSLNVKSRDNYTIFSPSTFITILSSEIKKVLYLNALEDNDTKNSKDETTSLFNVAADNKIGFLSLNKELDYTYLTERDNKRLPYVYLYQENLNPYSNFRTDPYYKQSNNPEYFTSSITSSCEIFSGDSYVNSMKYVNSIWYDTRMKKRKNKSSGFSIFISIILFAAAIALTIFSFGAGVGAIGAAALIAGGSVLAAVGTTLLISGLTQQAWEKAYGEMYAKGLRNTIGDEYMRHDYDPVNVTKGWRGFDFNPVDDEIQWLGEAINVWFESGVNFGLRHGATREVISILDSPANVETGVNVEEYNWENFGMYSVRSGETDIAPTTSLDKHMVGKLTYSDYKRKSFKSYLGIPSAELYLINKDYLRLNKQKTFNFLPIEYDCCSDCGEDFPHRWHWSEQAFQEELTDNFRVFLPNNYKDLEAETGKITDIFRIQNNLYIHTEEGLWHCPQTFQERVTNEVISFIGTGEYFSIPPRKIVDDSNSSAGNRHKWARTKTKYGVLFPSVKEKKWYIFNGEQLQPISDNGNSVWFKSNMDFLVEQQYYNTNLEPYPYSNNPSNRLGVGFLSTYDSNKERFITTKKDFKITNLPQNPYILCSDGDSSVIFNNPAQIIANRLNSGWSYKGIEDCKMKFQKQESVFTTELVNQFGYIEADMNIVVVIRTNGDFGTTMTGTAEVLGSTYTLGVGTSPATGQLLIRLNNWINTLRTDRGWLGDYRRFRTDNDRWLQYPNLIPLAQREKTLFLIFTNGANPSYHSTFEDPMAVPTAEYIADFNNFTGPTGVYSTYPKFNALLYVSRALSPSPWTGPLTNVVLDGSPVQHSQAAVKGRDFTEEELTHPNRTWSTTTGTDVAIVASLLDNPYKTILDYEGDSGLEKYNWTVENNLSSDRMYYPTSDCPRAFDGTDGVNALLTECEIDSDVNNYFDTKINIVEIQKENFVTVTEYVTGTPFVPQLINNSWTFSYSLKRQEWRSWHPYLPSFYMHVQEKFYSWIQGSPYIWRHNKLGHYRTFYGVTYPFIVEYVDNPSPITTKMWSYLMFQTEAKQYDSITQEYMDVRDTTFNKVLFYNTEQTSGILNVAPKQNTAQNYMLQQTQNNTSIGNITADRNERDWTLNDMRDIRINTSTPMFIKDVAQLQSNYYIDKIVNPAAISTSKSWNELESFRDKYLSVRLIFDTFDTNKKLTFYYSSLQKEVSER